MHFNTVLNFLENAALTPILKEMIVEASRPAGIGRRGFRGRFDGIHDDALRKLV